ncbi:unnamed protein product [Mytilus coruscus]|uniref:Uncharacterized protein n=1 Tax=Mytilus coruscus TaxID=42192 RepID=A0A6J8D3J0_MYTCO|nr:unnamed protein product [Mytilus coruscus]
MSSLHVCLKCNNEFSVCSCDSNLDLLGTSDKDNVTNERNFNDTCKFKSNCTNLDNCLSPHDFSIISPINMTFNNTKEVITETACNLEKSKTQLDDNDYTNNIYGHQKTKGLKTTFQNIQHLLPKLDEIKYNFTKMKDWEKPHVLGMCETFLTPEKSKELDISGFTFERKDRKTSKGGAYFQTSVDKHVTIKYRNFTKFNQEKFIEDLKAKNFKEILYFDNPDHALDAWYSKLLNVLNKHAPIITKRVKIKSQPKWLNQDINQLRAKRDFYHKKKDFENYKLFRNKLSAQINKCKTDYFSKAVLSNSKTSEIWKHLKDLNAVSKCPITNVTFQGSDVNEPGKVCEHFNEHFGTVAESIIPNPKSNFESPKLKEFIEEIVGDNYFKFYCLQ